MTSCTTYRTGGRGMEGDANADSSAYRSRYCRACEVFKDDARRLELTAPL